MDRSKSHRLHFSIHVRESASMLAARDFGKIALKKRWIMLIVLPLVSL
jgi:hypothetical protein